VTSSTRQDAFLKFPLRRLGTVDMHHARDNNAKTVSIFPRSQFSDQVLQNLNNAVYTCRYKMDVGGIHRHSHPHRHRKRSPEAGLGMRICDRPRVEGVGITEMGFAAFANLDLSESEGKCSNGEAALPLLDTMVWSMKSSKMFG
jgi:hypothetical protein